jgi:sterol desaturase/sphingolipid hydroxylase (fatty acid hydroxylase superfamily)
LSEWLLEHEPALRLGCFAVIFAVMASWEFAASRRERVQSRGKRWFLNLVLSALSMLTVRILFPTAAVGIALVAEQRGWGLFNQVELPRLLAIILSVVLLDLAIYAQHAVFHFVPVLWRLHRVHHSDRDFDLTTGIRFHPIEIVLSIVIKFSVVIALGAPPVAVLIFAIVLNATSMFNHGNVRIPRSIDRWLRWAVVTPDMHRVHHSVETDETNSNFGFNLPWWDRAFGTYRAQPRAGHLEMTIGLQDLQQADPGGLLRLLIMPFKKKA